VITVIGGAGFVGRRLVEELERRGLDHCAPARDEPLRGALGDVVMAAGVTGDFHDRPLDTIDAHVGLLERVLRHGEMDSVTVLSSTRVYRPGRPAGELDPVEVDPSDPDRLYDLSKLAAESLALASGVPALVLRLANVYGVEPGSPNFLAAVLAGAVRDGRVTLRTTLDSARWYVGVDDAVGALLALLGAGARGIFNVAGERAVTHREVADALTELTGCAIEVAPGARTEVAPAISLERLRAAIDFRPESVLDALPRLVDGYRHALSGAAS
jgi:nucleoside-diphosphate-sugar epimerase